LRESREGGRIADRRKRKKSELNKEIVSLSGKNEGGQGQKGWIEPYQALGFDMINPGHRQTDTHGPTKQLEGKLTKVVRL
jgi:hypothetical protein